MYQSVGRFDVGERQWRKYSFHIWPRSKDPELIKGKA
jgi:hypothetical protein